MYALGDGGGDAQEGLRSFVGRVGFHVVKRLGHTEDLLAHTTSTAHTESSGTNAAPTRGSNSGPRGAPCAGQPQTPGQCPQAHSSSRRAQRWSCRRRNGVTRGAWPSCTSTNVTSHRSKGAARILPQPRTAQPGASGPRSQGRSPTACAPPCPGSS